MPSPGRDQGPLDPATKVLEMESLGLKVRFFSYACTCSEDMHLRPGFVSGIISE